MTPSSLPVIPPEPTGNVEPISARYLFQNFNRAQYKGKFGVQAPPFDKRFLVKSWFDTSGNAPNYTVVVITGGSAEIKPLVMDKIQAATPNLYGDYEYDPYVNSLETPAVISFFGTSVPLNAAQLCQYDDAVSLAVSLKAAAGGYAPQEDASEANIVWNGETRRIWNVSVAGVWQTAAPLLYMMYRKGKGTPGSWDLSSPSAPKWVFDPEPDWSSIPVVPVPINPPGPDMHLQQAGPLGMDWCFVRG